MPIELDYEAISTNGQLRARVTATQNGRTVWRDTIDLGSAIRRQQFAREASTRAGVSLQEIEHALLQMGDRQAQQQAIDAAVQDGPADPHRLAGACIQNNWNEAGVPTVRHWRDEFHLWNGTAYVPLSVTELRSRVTATVRAEFNRLAMAGVADREGHKLKVTRPIVADIAQALASTVQVSDAVDQPAWLDGTAPAPITQLIAAPNGLVDVVAFAEGRPYLYDPTPRLFTPNGIDYNFDPEAACPQWLDFLNRVWPDDPESIETLGEMFGYCLLPDTSLQKAFLLVGPKRSGRGTMMRVLAKALGPSNVVGPTLKSLQGDFGLQPLLGKLVAVISDARLSGRHDIATIVERLLSISGEDRQTVNRKRITMVTTTLLTRIIVVTNELPNLRDNSGALAGRFVILRTTRSWYGQEDSHLTNRLLDELPGILNWAIEGLRRLRERGHFIQPSSAVEFIRHMERLCSPIQAFLNDWCDVHPQAETPRYLLFQQWRSWCQLNNVHSGNEPTFGRDLRAVLPELGDSHPTIDGTRVWCYRGIRLRSSSSPAEL